MNSAGKISKKTGKIHLRAKGFRQTALAEMPGGRCRFGGRRRARLFFMDIFSSILTNYATGEHTPNRIP
jgi:hypothetical protein